MGCDKMTLIAMIRRSGLCFTFLVSGFFVFARHGKASDQIPAKPQDHPIALAGGVVHTVSGPNIEEGTVLFVDGKITAVGADVELAAGIERIDISGKHVYPGLISASSKLGLTEIGAVDVTQDTAESGDINPHVRVETAINPDSELLPVARANGITLAHIVPGGGLIRGSSALIVLDGWTWEDMTFKAPAGLHISWPSMRIRRGPNITKSETDQKKDRDKEIQKLRDAFAEARAYMKAKEAEAKKGVPYHATDIRWEAMIPALKKEIPVLLQARSVVEIQTALDWAAEEDLAVILVTGQDVRFVADMLKERKIPVICGGTLTLPRRRWEAYDNPFTVPLKLHEAGVVFCITGTRASSERNLPYQAAMAAAYGLPREEALKAITLYPAQILGVADRVGSLEVGKDATLIVTDGDPLEIMTHVEMEFIQGRRIDLTSRHTQLYEKYKTKYERMGLSGGKAK